MRLESMSGKKVKQAENIINDSSTNPIENHLFSLEKRIKHIELLNGVYRQQNVVISIKFLIKTLINRVLRRKPVAVANINQLPSIIDIEEKNKASLINPVSQPATYAQVTDELFYEWCNKLKLTPFPHRKAWEFVYISRILELNNMFTAGKSGCGFGVGKDPIIGYMASHDVDVLATDLELDAASKKGWVDSEQFSTTLEDLIYDNACTLEKMKQHVTLKDVDMNNIPEDIGSFDFVWSACALEHLGSIQQGLDFIRNTLKHLKPGGIAIHTTELNLSSNTDTVSSGGTVLFRVKDFISFAEELKSEGYEIKLNFDIGSADFDRFVDIPPYSPTVHLKLELESYITTSYGLLIKKL